MLITHAISNIYRSIHINRVDLLVLLHHILLRLEEVYVLFVAVVQLHDSRSVCLAVEGVLWSVSCGDLDLVKGKDQDEKSRKRNDFEVVLQVRAKRNLCVLEYFVNVQS